MFMDSFYEYTLIIEKIPIATNTNLNPKGAVIIDSIEDGLYILNSTDLFRPVCNLTFTITIISNLKSEGYFFRAAKITLAHF